MVCVLRALSCFVLLGVLSVASASASRLPSLEEATEVLHSAGLAELFPKINHDMHSTTAARLSELKAFKAKLRARAGQRDASLGRAFGFPLRLFHHNVTVSGLSAGAYFGVQYHFAHSSALSGAAIVAGGPFYCALSNVGTAVTACMQDPQLISNTVLVAAAVYARAIGTLDDLNNLYNQTVYMFSGEKDSVVHQGVCKKLLQFYYSFVHETHVSAQFNIPAEHSMVTDDWGHACGYLGAPFINNCDFPLAPTLLDQIYRIDGLRRAAANFSNIFEFEQTPFIHPGYTREQASLGETGYVYVPDKCQQGSTTCSLHFAFHGCAQGASYVNTTYVKYGGYLEWAEAHDTVVVFPQVTSNPFNPNGCFDWWGYTGADYSCQLGVQVAFVDAIREAFMAFSA